MNGMKTVGTLLVLFTLSRDAASQIAVAGNYAGPEGPSPRDGARESSREGAHEGGGDGGDGGAGVGEIPPLDIDLSPILSFQSLFSNQLAPEMTKFQTDLTNSMQAVNDRLSEQGEDLDAHVKSLRRGGPDGHPIAGGDGDSRPRFFSVISTSQTSSNIDGEPTGEAETIVNNNGKITKYHDSNPINWA